MKVAVSGATGFIGRHVLSFLQSQRVESIAIVRPSSINQRNIYRSFTVEIDLHNPPLNAYDLMGRPDVLIHLAYQVCLITHLCIILSMSFPVSIDS